MDCKIAENPSIVESLEWSISLLRILNFLYSGILCISGKNLTDGGVHYYKVLLYIISCCLNIIISYDKTWFWFFFPFTGKGLDKDHQSSPFKPALLTVVDIEKKYFLIWILLWTIIFPRRNKKPRKFACDEKKKHYLYLSSFV